MPRTLSAVRGCFRGAIVLLFVTGAAGCGSGPVPVRGTVTLEDGTPVTNGMVTFVTKDVEKAVTARGEIQSNGAYKLGTFKPGDGAPPGVYRVIVSPPAQRPDDPPVKLSYDERYTDFSKSQLEFEVKSGDNDIPIRLAPRPK
jgi:hypothetical protein